MGTNFAKEFRLYENLFSNNTTEPLTEAVELTESFISSIKGILSKLSDKIDETTLNVIAKQVIRNMETANEPKETEMSEVDNTAIFKSGTTGSYVIKKDDEALVEKVSILADHIYNYDDTFAGYEIFTYLLTVLNVPFQYYFED